MGNYTTEWRPSHGSPNVLNLGCGNRVVRLYSRNDNFSTRKSEGMYIDLNNLGVTLDTSKKYKIIVSYRYSLPSNPNRSINFDVYFANGMTEKSNNGCDEETFPTVSDKMKVLTFTNGQFLDDTYTCQVKYKEQGQISPSKSYRYLWITSNLNTTASFREYVDIDKIEMYFDNGSGNTICTLPKPTNLQVTSTTYNSASISWSPVSGAQKYRVRYYLRGTQDYQNFQSVQTSFGFSSLFPNTAYQADVSPICSSGEIDGNHVAYVKFNTPCPVNLPINDPITTSQNYPAISSIIASSVINDGLNVSFHAGNYVLLLPGFSVKASANSAYRAYIEGCTSIPLPVAPEEGEENQEETESDGEMYFGKKNEEVGISNSDVKVFPNPVSHYFQIDTGLEKIASWQLFDSFGKLIKMGTDKVVNVESIPDGNFVLIINLEKTQISKTIIVKH